MKIIDRYILSKFFSTFFFCILLLTAIVVVVDISEKTGDFTKSKLTISQIITEHYFGFIPRIDAMLFPLFVFIAVIFFTSKMANRTEIVAILSSGVSFRRFLLPYLFGSILLAGILWLGYQYVVPNANRKWSAFEAKYIDGPGESVNTFKRQVYRRLDANSFFGIRGYDTISKSGNGFFVQRFLNAKLVYNLRAENFLWDTLTHKWKLQNVVERKFDSLSEKIIRTPSMLVSYNFKPRDLRLDEFLKDQMPTKELDEFIEQEKLRGVDTLSSLLVERYNRDAIPVSVIVLTLIGAVLASQKVRGGSGLHLALGMIISVTYILFSRFSLIFATKGNFSPLLAAWVPNIIFGVLLIYLYKKSAK